MNALYPFYFLILKFLAYLLFKLTYLCKLSKPLVEKEKNLYIIYIQPLKMKSTILHYFYQIGLHW